MSCRIDRVVTAENLVVLFVSGRITGEHVDILRSVLEQESGGFVLVQPNHVLRTFQLAPHHKDPFDRLLVAQAFEEDAALMTSDPRIPEYPVEIIW